MVQREIKIGSKTLGENNPCYIIIEVGTTHLGDIDKAFKLIESGAAAGADAVKFQLIDPFQISNTDARYEYRVGNEVREHNMQSMFQKLSFSERQWIEIKNACDFNNVEFFATVDFESGVDTLENLNVKVHKIGGWDITYRQLIEKVGRTGKPMFVDLGGNEEEVEQCVQWFRSSGGKEVLFMHDFHTSKEEQMNMRALEYLRDKYPWPVGFSSPGTDDDLDLIAVALGANYLEKRLILNREDGAYHAHQSLEPEELKLWVEKIRKAEKVLGERKIIQTDADRRMSFDYYRSICALKDIEAGEFYSLDNIGGKRPGTGIPTARLGEYIGKKATRDISKDTLLAEEDK